MRALFLWSTLSLMVIPIPGCQLTPAEEEQLNIVVKLWETASWSNFGQWNIALVGFIIFLAFYGIGTLLAIIFKVDHWDNAIGYICLGLGLISLFGLILCLKSIF